ncbi:hypothetical protein [Carboxylicivirga sp. M1479]|uniref:hypothetical protein n=1 Tax=Carboxylicivirga sp. M1479 TaxID=2594476 RepID=UPI0011775880|nr:hypothetical protein [Carboxylicivirga sp. M1479]TRX65863.1 hypothetical protein FNN09_16365 [Carboxylicivirga sp. M1479]
MTRILIVFTALLLSMSSCLVSKKKYDALLLENSELEQNLSDQTATSNKLQADLEKAVNEYEAMQGDFGKSNALKTDEISDLMIMVTQLKDESEQLNSKLNETVTQIKAKEAASYMADEELRQTIKSMESLKRDTASINYSLELAKKRNQMLQGELRQSQEKASASGIKRVEIQKQLDEQSTQLKEMERQLVKSQQNMSEVSTAFIALRKELLKANTNKKPLDPNKSKEVNKVAKLLGHY